ncbi:IclR family transcriptional regulator [Paracoccus denitrificans]|nr:IclR family transcriptional regulator [Paracoccus denitrificans]MBB4629011.1 DNA-binding IclR family transcriptional regulator [Paracoccus denitrificans]MCU7430042.1 IclR family transcriptional regulator [Paracoccus denitrificans]QAR27194.1 IclR family transcriptional regulator [Paracoccus denitrificans]UPV96163.1 IclR family transcriptional regulator [Paracoccus denitrificans]WQO34473.1 IclR family transcriptional regulator [Paracoccus denitrificans]
MPLETPSDGPLDRALAILDFVASQRKPVTTVEIAQELGLPVPTAHRLISNLEARQMVQKAPGTKRFWVGNRLVVLAGKTISNAFRTARRHAVLTAVAGEIGEQCEIGIVRNNRVVYVDSVRVAPSQGLQFDPGTDAPLYCTSTGKIYLSRMPGAARDKLVRTLPMQQHTPNTITDPDALLAVLAEVRRKGWASTNEEYVQGVVGCAVPITAPDGTLIACLGVSVPTARVRYDELGAFIEPLQRAAHLLAQTILDGEDEDG